MLKKYFNKEVEYEAGCDEAGRGCLAGPVFAAAVIFPKKYSNKELNDSKLLTEEHRFRLRKIVEQKALAYAVGIVSNAEIDEINILNASFLAMHRALNQLSIVPHHLIIDGNRFNAYKEIPHTCIVEGDAKYLSIAAASILAKTYRDEYMQRIHQEFPQYAWNTNKGYPTKTHRNGILNFGATPHHRMTFTLLAEEKVLEV